MASTRIIDRDTGFKAFIKRLRKMDGMEVVVGIRAKEGGVPREGGITVAEIGQIHEFGAPAAGIPQRSFLRETFDKNRKKYDRVLAKGVKGVVKAKDDPRKKLFVLGETARTDIIDRIDAGDFEPLLPATIKRKGSDKPLVDKGILRASIKSVVRKKTTG